MRWEVHIPQEMPTSQINKKYFGQGDDASNPNQSIYYVRKGNYPFAFFLSRATESDLSKLLDSANEKTAINLLYSGYDGWVSSNGEKNKDWYKKKKLKKNCSLCLKEKTENILESIKRVSAC